MVHLLTRGRTQQPQAARMFDPSDYVCGGKRGMSRGTSGRQATEEPTERTPLLVTKQPGTKGRQSRERQRLPLRGEMLYPEMIPGVSFAYQRKAPRLRKQSRSGWADSDSEEEYRRDPSRRPEDSTLQSYLVIAVVIAILAILAAIKGYHIYHGTEEREENRPKGGYY